MKSSHMNSGNSYPKALLTLEDGTSFEGNAFGASGEGVGELCFNTSMTGYQEIITDPSYAGQIVVLTASHIGNVGVNAEDMESDRPALRGLVIKDAPRMRSNWRSQENLSDFLKRFSVVAIEGVDTRELTRLLREKGAQRAVITTTIDSVDSVDMDALAEKARGWPGLKGMNLTEEVACERIHPYQDDYQDDNDNQTPHVVVMDFGVKRHILKSLSSVGARLTVVPPQTTVKEILSCHPDGIFLSNGPGDPDAVTNACHTVRTLIQHHHLPMFGICLGHQILALALGARTEKMKFGHHGGNHPVQNLMTSRVEVTAQNHGFVVSEETLPKDLVPTHRSLFDGTLEGMRHRNLPIFSVQHHPEASPGPHDAHYLFQDFMAMMRSVRAAGRAV